MTDAADTGRADIVWATRLRTEVEALFGRYQGSWGWAVLVGTHAPTRQTAHGPVPTVLRIIIHQPQLPPVGTSLVGLVRDLAGLPAAFAGASPEDIASVLTQEAVEPTTPDPLRVVHGVLWRGDLHRDPDRMIRALAGR